MTVETQTNYLTHRQILVVHTGVMAGMLLAALDQSIVGTALPRIVSDLGGLDKLSWVVTAYLLTSTAVTPLWGKIGDLYGRKNIFLSSIVIFLIGSALSGMSQSMDQLIAFRALQGLGAGGLVVGVMSIIGELVPPRERGQYQGIMSPLVELPQPCVEVSADRCEAGAGKEARQLRDAAYAAGADRRGLAEALKHLLDG